MTPTPSDAPVLALVRDLLFATKISGTGRLLGTAVEIVRDPARLARTPGRLLLVDLNLDGAIPAAAAWARAHGRRAVGFVSHVDTPTIASARQAGIPEVLPRSRFVERLPELLAPAFSSPK